MGKYKICIVTGTRAEYGLLKNIILKCCDDDTLELSVIATGMHLETEFGHTIDEIRADGIEITAEVPCLSGNDSDEGTLLAISRAVEGFAEYFNLKRPDFLIVLGDRFEIFACATAAAVLKIPIAHLYGGDTTEGAIDEFFRHSITKMSYLHFVSNEESRKRVIQLGESPERVFNVGATGAENIKSMEFLSKEELEKSIDFSLGDSYAVVTFHPVTMEEKTAEQQVEELFKAIEKHNEIKFIFTKANADANGRLINNAIDNFAAKHENCRAFESLGLLRYLSALKYADMVIGNSSSGIYEAPLFGIPTINIGDRQKGRLQGESIINCEPTDESILSAIDYAKRQPKYNADNTPYYKKDTSKSIVDTIKRTLEDGSVNLKKTFYEIG